MVALKSGSRRFEVGDELEYEHVDRIEFKKATYRNRVVSADDKKVVFSSGLVLDQMGSTLRNQFGEKDPGALLAPADIEVGKKWRTAFTNRNPKGRLTHNFYDVRVVRMEAITVPAGQFTAFRIERSGAAVGENRRQTQVGTTWIDPKTMYNIKNEFVFFRGGRRVQDQSDTLVSVKLAPR